MTDRLMNVGFRIPTNLDAEQAERAFDLRQYLNFVWRNWLFIVAVTAVAFLIGIVNLVRAVPLYTASTPRARRGAFDFDLLGRLRGG